MKVAPPDARSLDDVLAACLEQTDAVQKIGVVFLAWLNGFQEHFVMLGGAQSMRPLHYFVDCFQLADRNGLLRDPELAVGRTKTLLALCGTT